MATDKERVLTMYDEGRSENGIANELLVSRHYVRKVLVQNGRLAGKYKYRHGMFGYIGVIRDAKGVEQERIKYRKIFDEAQG